MKNKVDCFVNYSNLLKYLILYINRDLEIKQTSFTYYYEIIQKFINLPLIIQNSLIKLLNRSHMQQVGAFIRRKSYGNVQPVLPRKIYTRELGTRTTYKQIPLPSDQLKGFRRRMLFQSFPSVQSLPDINKNSGRTNKTQKNEGNKNMYNERKNNPTLMTMVSQTDLKSEKNKFFTNNHTAENSIVQNINQGQIETNQIIRLNIDQDKVDGVGEGDGEGEVQNIDGDQGYTMGNQITGDQDQDEKNKNVPKLKSYMSGGNYMNGAITNTYQTLNQPQARMELRYITAKYQAMRSKKENQEMVQMINKYKFNKQLIQKQSKRKAQTMRALANMKRASSLPRLSQPNEQNVRKIVVPSYEQLSNPDGNPEQIKRKVLGKRLEGSLSFGRLQMINTSHKNKNVNYEGYLQQQIGYALQTQRILREKGVHLSSNTLKNSLINLRQIPIEISEEVPFPKPKLISNPLLPKETKKKKK